ncbi:MAG: energy-coupling factor ABC transporter permease [Candidatus Eisenbacteria bacterium]|nr:energy-coupling factor ABC transporter permease [Candidatus Eisenbacteria bacterium]
MSIPLGPFEYHLTLAGPIGVLLGGAGSFQVAFIVSTILALMGHGGLTVIGLNALILGSAAVIARGAFPFLRHRLAPGPSLAIASGAGQAVAGLLWLVIVTVALRGSGATTAAERTHLAPVAAVAIPLWALGIVAEGAVAWGLARFLARVRPELLGPAPDDVAPRAVAEGGAA